MRRYKRTSVIGIGLLGLGVGYFALHNQTAKSAEQPTLAISTKPAPTRALQLINTPTAPADRQKNSKKAVTNSDDPKNWWPEYQPLNKEEEKEFEIVLTQVGRYYDWGEMEKESLPAFRGTLGAYNERAVAHIVRTLASLKSDSLKTEAEAEGATRQLDFLRYMADNLKGFSRNAVQKLATRTFSDEEGKTDQTAFQVSLEAFQIFTIENRDAAMEYLSTKVPDGLKRGYAYNYWLGRKLSGIAENTALNELREKIDAEFLPQ